MKPSLNRHPAAPAAAGMQAALTLLLEASAYARELRRSRWDFAVEIQSLRTAGLTNSALRWLVLQGYAEHAAETTPAGKRCRSFRPTGELTFTERTCVVLTKRGVSFARTAGLAQGDRSQPGGGAALADPPADPPRPRWDSAHRVLWVGSHIVKRFRQPAPSQETILATFEEEGWPPHIDDPLPPQPGQLPKQRLHETITNLNRHQQNRLLHFLGDGTGRGVCWQLRA